ncbi:MAG: efflux RND transporter periplasmic adaptor subunit [Spirochaetaceae bacterium]|jgi:multidrug resistance efflux pump|nr:efflux RND transporter periplasmic adaptor subunit [Spirochaetaceae bacterium]
MKKKLVYIIIISLIIIFIVIGVISRNSSNLMKVKAYTVEAEDFSKEVSSNGEIISKESIELVSTVSGKISSINLETGDLVQEGDLILSLDLEDLEIQKQNLISTLESTRMIVRKELISLRSAYMQAVTGYEQAEREYLRSEDLHKKEFTSDVELQSRRDAYHIANDTLTSAMQQLRFREGRDPDISIGIDSRTDDQIVEESPEVQKAKLNLKSLESNMGNYTFRSSIDGVITSINVEEGGVVSPGVIVASVHNIGQLEVIANIDEVDLSYISINQEVKIESDSFIGTELKGNVTKIAPIILKIGDSRVCEIRVDLLENPDLLAKIGASCSIFITVENKIARPAIPVESYFIEDNKKYVFLLEAVEYDEDTFVVKKQEIETGILGIETVEVIKGIEVGDIVLNSDRTGILEGDEVKRLEDD